MPAETDADRLALLDEDDFAVFAELQDMAPVRVIFDSEYLPVDVFEQTVQSTVPVIFGRSSDIGHLKNNDPVFVNGIDYKVAEGPQNDGTGMTLVRLRK